MWTRLLLLVRRSPFRYCLCRNASSSGKKKGLVLGVYEPESENGPIILSKAAEAFDKRCSGKLVHHLNLFNKSFKKGKSRLLLGLDDEFAAVSIVNIGKKRLGFHELEGIDEGRDNVRVATADGVLKLRELGGMEISVDPCGVPDAAAEGSYLSVFSFDELKSKDKRKPKVSLSCFVDNLQSDRSRVIGIWNKGVILAESQNFARQLMEMPSNKLTPVRFAEAVKEKLGNSCTVLVRNKEWAESQKMGAFLSVGKGSWEAPIFLEVDYIGEGAEKISPVALVGKGITFDSGGISLKPAANMDKMRGDMGGAACVLGILLGILKLRLPLYVKAFVPLCENMPSGRSVKPGDVVTAMNGKTIQVDNTDAEGRLILADALCYAETFKPRFILDMATLTGAIAVALGSAATGTYSNSSALWELLTKAGSHTGDRVWRMPLLQHYSRQVKKSHLADLSNIGGGKDGGSCTAAAFLKEFVSESKWLHLDIAGVMSNKNEIPYLGTGMTGRPTRTVIEFLSQFSKQAKDL